MEKLHELSRTTVLRRRDPAHSRVLTAEKRQIRHVVSRTQVTGNATYRAHALNSLPIQDTSLLDWLNATLKNGFDKTAGSRVTFCGCLCFEPSFARYLPSSLES
jgi:hypothetical protein